MNSREFLSKPGVAVVSVSLETAEIFGEIRNRLRATGTMIPLNDIWIAAHAIENGSKLVAFDSHFEQIVGLRLWERLER